MAQQVNLITMSKDTYAIVKYNSGNLALLCSSCRKIVKVGYEFSDEEVAYAKGEVEHLDPLYCEKCEIKKRL